tara:strand:- start:28 stop:495 length:468 start_codon:yes stop_codon:yes gene_type:complete
MNINKIIYNPYGFSTSYHKFVRKSVYKIEAIRLKRNDSNIQMSNIRLAKTVRSLWLVHNRYINQLHENMETVCRKRRLGLNKILSKGKEIIKIIDEWSTHKNIYNINQISYFKKVIITLNKTSEIMKKRNEKNVNVLLQTTNMPTDVINHVLSFV